ncbi:DUF2637 domain-containing protein [Streptomyces sp. NPDC059913]|uniref:DUF2637 domain-containing protein n=1 Tax=unclassified Streptomyces TaxID=2593676 RepID=UPI003659F1A9
MTATTASKTAHTTGWDRTVIIALGAAGCALSYDALQQMAIAIHIRGFLTYLFPLVIDGFIAYGVRALLVLRDAPLRARLYVWTLFGTATAASIWANALHAVRLNEQAVADTSTGLRLGDTVVAVLSTIAPLALAGAVHLYIIIARNPAQDGDRDRQDTGQDNRPGRSDRPGSIAVTRTDRIGQPGQATGQGSAGQPVTALTDRPHGSPDTETPSPRPLTGNSAPTAASSPVAGHPVKPSEPADLPGQPDTTPQTTERPNPADPGTVRSVTHAPVTDRGTRTPDDRPSDPDTEELLAIARSAVRAEDKLTRKVVAQAIRGQQIPLSNDTLTGLMVQLRRQHGQPVTAHRP